MCGIVGVFNSEIAPELTYYALYALQHRGQESAGIASADGKRLSRVSGGGLISEVFTNESFLRLPGTAAIGHVRYATSGGTGIQNCQPIMEESRFGPVALVHNGNLTNQGSLRDNLIHSGAVLQTQSDSELILHIMARSKKERFEDALIESLGQLRGAFNFLLLTPKRMYVAMDPYGFRPLVYGKLGDAHIVASETVGLDHLKDPQTDIMAKFHHDIKPGQVWMCDENGFNQIHQLQPARESKYCVFEHIYFSRPDSEIYGKPVMSARNAFGSMLATESPVAADIVVPVPDSGTDAAIGYSRTSGIPLARGLIRNTYAGRSFTKPEQAAREKTVRVKLNPVRNVLRGKRVVLVDDSIVRGTTSRKIISMVRNAGALEVHFRVSSPPVIGPCYYGIDTPQRTNLIASSNSVEEIKEFLKADSLAYLSEAGLRHALGNMGHGYCFGCMNNDYPLLPDSLTRAEYDRRRKL